MKLGADHAGDGSGGEHLQVDALRMLVHEGEKLDAQDGDLLI